LLQDIIVQFSHCFGGQQVLIQLLNFRCSVITQETSRSRSSQAIASWAVVKSNSVASFVNWRTAAIFSG